MTHSTIPVTTHQFPQKQVCDPLSSYYAACHTLGSQNVFLLESLSGPARDRKASIVGVDPLFSIHLHHHYAELVGQPTICETLVARLQQAGFRFNTQKQCEYRHKEELWDILRTIRHSFSVPEVPYTLGYFGYFAYETIRFIEDIPEKIAENYTYPVIALAVYQTYLVYPIEGEAMVVINNSPLWAPKTEQDYLPFLASSHDTVLKAPIHYPENIKVKDTIEKEPYLECIKEALQYIKIGDIYQIQIGHEIHITSEIPPFEVYRALRQNNPSPYMYIAHIGGIDLIGASPELFVGLKENMIEMRPIAGTVGKKPGINHQELIRSMMESEKERAEHVMLVDLCRNDIGRVCKAGSLEVDQLMIVEEYSHLFHMVSNVKGQLQNDEYDVFDVIKATFPQGTMTGAPKVRAMELIEKFETSKRGIYAGTVGIIGFNDMVNTALCIRSTFYQNGTYHLRASAGVVIDSVPEKEWMETLYKMSSVFRAVTGKELIQ